MRRGQVWQAQVRTGKDPATGRWIRKSATADTKAKAEAAERALLAEAEQNRQRFVDPTTVPLREFVAGWRQREYPRMRPGTRTQYTTILEVHVLPALGDVRLDRLSPAQVQGWVDGIGATQRAEDARRLLGTILKDAVRLGKVAANVVERTKAPYRKKPKRQSFTLEQGQRVFAATADSRIGPMVRVAFYTGLRRGELLGLRWDDVDLDGRTLRVQRQVTVEDQRVQVQDMPKTDAGRREVPLVGPAVDAIKAQRAMLAKERLRSRRRPVDPGWVFPSRKGTPLDPNLVSRTFKRMVLRTDVPFRPFHALRHSAASVFLSAGVAPEICAKIMGHASYATFYTLYADLLAPAAYSAAQQVDAFLSGGGSGAPMSANLSAKQPS